MINNSNVLKLLNLFSKRELKALGQMLHSPYFNSNELCISLFELIKKQVLENGRELSKQQIIEVLKLREKSSSYLSVLLSKLNVLAEEVLILEQLRLAQDHRNLLLITALRDKGMDKAVKKIGGQMLETIKKKPEKKRQDFLFQFYFSKILYDLKITTVRKEHLDPKTIIKKLDDFYLCNRYQLTYEMMNVQQFMSIELDREFCNSMLDIGKAVYAEEVHLVQLYKSAVLMMKGPDSEAYYQTILEYLAAHHLEIPNYEIHTLFTVLGNFCIQQIVAGRQDYYRQMFKIYNQMINAEVLFVTKYIPPSQFKNVITLSCKLKEFEWALSFLGSYRKFLDPASADEYYQFLLATIYFHQEDYEAAKSQLIQPKNPDLFFEIGRRSLLAKIYYELEEGQALLQFLDTFKDYVRKNKVISFSIKVSYNNFIKMLRLIAKARITRGMKKWKSLKIKLESYDKVSDKKWLSEKLGELG